MQKLLKPWVVAKLLLSTLFLCYGQATKAQNDSPENSSLQGKKFYVPDSGMTVMAYPYIREADIMWQTRIWRTIDLREKMNHSLYYPLDQTDDRISLFDALKQGIYSQEIVAYNDLYDDFRKKLTPQQVADILRKPKMIQQEDPDMPGTFTTVYDTVEISSKDVIEYLIKEDWVFDKQRSVLEVRIIGICPVVKTYDDATGAERGKRKLFWLYFPNCRPTLMKTAAFYRHNQGANLTFDQVFSKRIFSSYITKNSNVYDRAIADYETGLDFFLEGEKIKDDILIFESDLWQY